MPVEDAAADLEWLAEAGTVPDAGGAALLARLRLRGGLEAGEVEEQLEALCSALGST